MNNLVREIKEDNRVVAGWLLYYHERKKEYEQRREEILESSPPTIPDSPIRGTQTGDSTGSKGGRLADLDAGEWLKLVEDVEKGLPWKMQIVLRLKREFRHGVRGRPVRWRIALELSEEVSRRIGKDYSVGPEQVDQWWRRIVEYAARAAGKRGLLK